MHDPDATHRHRNGLTTKLAIAALSGATVAVMTLPAANADPTTPPPPPPPSGNTFLNGPPPAAPAPAPPAVPAPPPPADPNAPPPPPADPNAAPADPNAAPVPPPPPPEPGRVNNAAGGFSYVVPAGWKVADATQLSYGQALLNKIPAEATPPNAQGANGQPAQPAQPPSDTSVLLGRLDLKLFAGAETDNTKAAQRLASDMGEFFMPFPGTRINQDTVPLNAGGMTGVASYYEVKFTDASKPTGQIWAGVVGSPTPPGAPRGQRAPDRWFVVWLGTANNPVPKPDAITLAQSIRPYTPPPPPPPDPNAPPPPVAGTNAPGQRPEVGVPMPVTNAPPEMQPGG